MKKNNIMGKAIAGLVAGSVILSMSVYAFADTTDASSGASKWANGKKIFGERMPGKKGKFGPGFMAEGFKTQLDALVKAGTISQEQADKITSYINKKEEERKAEMDKVKAMTEDQRKAYFESKKPLKKVDMFKDLVDQKVITQAQADAIKGQMHQKQGDMGKGFDSDRMKAQLDNQVKAGVITQTEENNILSYLKTKAEAKKAEMDKVKAMSEAERKAYLEKRKSEPKVGLFEELVSKGILTQSKADALKKAMPMHQKPEFKGNMKHQ